MLNFVSKILIKKRLVITKLIIGIPNTKRNYFLLNDEFEILGRY